LLRVAGEKPQGREKFGSRAKARKDFQ
jgi:hypothetical protein